MEIFGLGLNSRKIAFILIFAALALVLNQFNFSEVVSPVGLEAQKYFTYFQFIGPIAGGILGSVGGVMVILLVGAVNILSGQAISTPVIVSIITMSFAAFYFGTKRRTIALVPLLCMLLFWLHPEGALGWYYALFWLIPLAAVYYKQNIYVRSLGATFTAHSIGSVAWLYAFGAPVGGYLPLMVITPMERFLFAAGITVFYYAVNTMLSAFSSRVDFSFLNIEKKYALWRS